VNEKNSFAGAAATGGAGASTGDAGSNVAPFWATTAGCRGGRSRSSSTCSPVARGHCRKDRRAGRQIAWAAAD